jgi:hypothetical protein
VVYPNVEIHSRFHLSSLLSSILNKVLELEEVVVLSLSSIKFHVPKYFKGDEVSKISKSQQRIQQMSVAIDEIASEVSRFVHHIVPNSPSAQARFKSDREGNSPGKDSTDNELVLQQTRREMGETFKKDIAELGWGSRAYAVAHAHSEYVKEVIKTGIGNCAEKALLAGILLKATMHNCLKQRGFSSKDIATADIQLTIEELENKVTTVMSTWYVD